MSMSDNDTNELDSYGVWVKHSSEEGDLQSVNEQTSAEKTDDSLDLPDFDDSDFSDMFKDDTQLSEDLAQDFGNDIDSTLSADELANITSGDISIEETPIVEATENSQTETSDELPDFDFDTDFPTEESATKEPVAEESKIEIPEPSFDELNLDDFETSEEVSEQSQETVIESESFDISEENAELSGQEEISINDFDISEETVQSESVQEDSTGEDVEEEISLDDFMDGGFSDESVASGNNGFEAGKGPSAAASETEEVSLDDFVDMSDFGMDAATEQKDEESIEDEVPLEMDISFDESVDSIETEDNISIDTEIEEEPIETSTLETEEVSLNDFGDDFVESVGSATDSEISTEEVDLSDFGIDSEAEETPIVQDVEESKIKETVVDYDLSVGDEKTESAPLVNEIKTKNEDDEAQKDLYEPVMEELPVKTETETVSTSLLQKIVADLSGLKDEINQLKSNLAEIKANKQDEPADTFVEEKTSEDEIFDEHPTIEEENFEETFAEEASNEESIIEEETSVESVDIEEPSSGDDSAFIEETVIPEIDTSSSGGFFDLDDTDETIALSGDELDNIFNSAEFSEVSVDKTVEEDSFGEETIDISISDDEENQNEEIQTENNFAEESTDEVSIEDSFVEETTEDTIADNFAEESTDEITIEDSFVEETIEDTIAEESLSIENSDDLPSEIPYEEPIETDEEIPSETFDIPETTDIDENLTESISNELESNDEVFDFENEQLEEPSFENGISVDEDENDLPDEISIPKTDDILVETNNSDFMDSVKDTTPEEESMVSNFEDIEETSEEVIQPTTEEIIELPEEDISEDSISATEETPVETTEDSDINFDTVDNFFEDNEPVVEETFVTDEEVQNEVSNYEETVEEVPEESTPVTEDTFEQEENNDFGEDVDNPNNDLTDSNLNYLTTKDDVTEEEIGKDSDLKKDIKSVLLYMDQLLENLPEDKIIEFAKSDEFSTYKKLFTELGLS